MDNNLLLSTWLRLTDDFQSHCHSMLLEKFRTTIQCADVSKVRDFVWPDYMNSTTDRVRMLYQIQAFGKRWVFDRDKYTEEELKKMAAEKFWQISNSRPNSMPNDEAVNRLLRKAREIAQSILGEYDIEEHKRTCRFGTKSCQRIPRSKSYLFEKLMQPSGSLHQAQVYSKMIMGDKLLMSAHRSKTGGKSKLLAVESLEVDFVPKSYKACRTIVPDTVFGSYYSMGLGELITRKLKANGLDLATLQFAHRRMAQSASKRGHLATADLSSASDSISWPLICRIFPEDWTEALKRDEIQDVTINGQTARSKIVLHTGKGYTFPIETLIFYSLIKGIRDLLGESGRVSVYGDDLIYPASIHWFVCQIFPKLGLILNTEKSFAEGPFRESCGGDYHNGTSVRPYMPEGASLDPKWSGEHGKCALICTLLNGLLSRWEFWEIPKTTRWLLIELQNTLGFIPMVPGDSPVTSGIREIGGDFTWPRLVDEWLMLREPVRRQVAYFTPERVRCTSWTHEYTYWRLKESKHPDVAVPRDREEGYLWDWLREKDQFPPRPCRPFTWIAPENRGNQALSIYSDAPERLRRVPLCGDYGEAFLAVMRGIASPMPGVKVERSIVPSKVDVGVRFQLVRATMPAH